MRTLRIAVLLGALGIAGFFMAPSFRQAISVAADTLNGAPWARRGNRAGHEERSRLRAIAERDRDAKMLAYLAVHEDDLQIAGQDADHAVAIDPQWTWVYYVLLSHHPWPYRPIPQAGAWAEKLRQWNPQNAVTYIVEAERRYFDAQATQASAEKRLDRHRTDWRTENRLWLEMMARAFDAPKYDSYFQNRFNLERDIAIRGGNISPLRFTVSMVSHPLPSIMGPFDYERFILGSAKAPSDLAQAARRVIAFGDRMMAGDTEIEQIVGQRIALDGYHKLQSAAAPDEEAFLAAQVTQLEKSQRTSIQIAGGPERLGILSALAVNAMIVEVCFVLILIAAAVIASAAAIFVFRRLKKSRAISIASSAAVGTMLVACIVAFVAYLPYAQVVAQAMDPRVPVKVSLPLLQTMLFFSLPPSEFLYGYQGRIYGWSILLTALVLAGLWLVVRQFRKPRPRPAMISAG